MLIQALAEYADSRLADRDPAFEHKPVPVSLELDTDGSFISFVSLEETVRQGKKSVTRARERLVPRSPVNRNSGEHPLLAFDDAKYVLGPGKKHEAFVDLISEAARATRDEALGACTRFYGRPDQVERARAAFDRKITGGILLSVAGAVVDRPAGQEFWRGVFRRKSTERNERGGTGMCLISGAVGPVAPTHDMIKGATRLGGQPSGVALMSFDKAAFRSYGWEKNENSPVSPDRARAYTAALNDLMGGFGKSRVDHNGVGFLYWTLKPVEYDPMAVLETADPDQVRRVLQLRSQGHAIEPNDFYLAAVSGNGGRLLVRQWFQGSLETVLRNVGAWFDGLRIRDAFSGEMAEAPPLWKALKALARDEAPPDREVQLVRRAITGVPLGKTILAAALARLRAAQGSERLSPVRAGLIRLALNDQITWKGEKALSEQLDAGFENGAYLCGRLLAIYDSLQWSAHEQRVGVTVADRYYSMASTYPALAFPKVADLGRKHLRKLWRDRPGAAKAIENEIDAILARMEDGKFPDRLNLEDQGRFVIGFHHQRAEGRARAAERKASKEQENTNDSE